MVSSTLGADGAGVVRNVPGNHFDKHGSRNPIVKLLMRRFHGVLSTEVAGFAAESILDVGCGEGRTTGVIAQLGRELVGLELETHLLPEASRLVPSAWFVGGSAYALPFGDRSFDVVIATEVLEHVHDPAAALAEMLRVARLGVVLTVPHEPWWRIANIARGRYLLQTGNTPGHINHWTRPSIRRELGLDEMSTVQTVGLWLLVTIQMKRAL